MPHWIKGVGLRVDLYYDASGVGVDYSTGSRDARVGLRGHLYYDSMRGVSKERAYYPTRNFILLHFCQILDDSKSFVVQTVHKLNL